MPKNIPKIKLMVTNKVKFNPDIRKLIKKCCQSVLIEENFVENVEISVILTNDDEIRALNKQYRNKDAVTDVLSFPMNDENLDTGEIVLGDIVINIQRAAEQAEQYSHSIEREIAFLTIHSMLHLLGYDHENDSGSEEIMREKQTRLLSGLGLARI